jgi:nucleoid-associated protein YgaU
MTAFLSVSVRAQDDAPDLKKEAKFHSIYKNFNTEPTSSQKWEAALGQTQSQRYDVQKGDTLWDISDTLFADPDFWPKVWSLNVEQIGNPHEISVGQRIRFTPGTAGEPPRLAVTDVKTDKSLMK